LSQVVVADTEVVLRGRVRTVGVKRPLEIPRGLAVRAHGEEERAEVKGQILALPDRKVSVPGLVQQPAELFALGRGGRRQVPREGRECAEQGAGIAAAQAE